jgi:hypothetical protein
MTQRVLIAKASPTGTHEESPAAYLLPVEELEEIQFQIDRVQAVTRRWGEELKGRVHSVRITPMPGQWLPLEGVHEEGIGDGEISFLDLPSAQTSGAEKGGVTTLSVDLSKIPTQNADHSELVISVMPGGQSGHVYASGYYSGLHTVPFESALIRFDRIEQEAVPA